MQTNSIPGVVQTVNVTFNLTDVRPDSCENEILPASYRFIVYPVSYGRTLFMDHFRAPTVVVFRQKLFGHIAVDHAGAVFLGEGIHRRTTLARAWQSDHDIRPTVSPHRGPVPGPVPGPSPH